MPTPPCTTTPELWWTTTPTAQQHAAAICHTCPLQAPCALLGADERYGVWGGRTPTERIAAQRGPGWWIDRHGHIRRPCGDGPAYMEHLKHSERCTTCTRAREKQTDTRRRRVLAQEHALPAGGSIRGYETHRALRERPCAACLAQIAVRSAASRARHTAA
ncbi:WhiB family transcriptional regulator [Streptomyces sp. NPDC001889]